MSISLPGDPSLLLQAGFVGLSLVMTAGFGWWTGRWRVAFLWLVTTGVLAYSGAFVGFTPPRVLFALVPALIWATRTAIQDGWWKRPVALIVGYQAFRIPVELLIHQAVVDGVAPPQFTWSGMNYDVITGITALLLFPFAGRAPSWLLHAWNLMGVALLLNVVTVAMLSMPSPIQQITPDNVWVAFFPYTWLPLVHVLLAWTGHVMLFVRLRNDQAR